MERILRGSPTKLSVTFYVDGVATTPQPDEATVTITRANGTPLITDGTAQPEGTFGTFTFDLLATDTALLDILSVAWTSSLGTVTDTIEIVGGFLFSIADARASVPLNDITKYTTDQIVDIRTDVEQTIEDACGVAFVPRYGIETLNFTGRGDVVPLHQRVTAIRSATLVKDTSDVLSTVTISPTGLISYGSPLFNSSGQVIVEYEHGYTSVPGRISRAALLLARSWLVSGPVDDRAASFAAENGVSYSLVVPGRGGSITGLPEVDAAIFMYAEGVGVA